MISKKLKMIGLASILSLGVVGAAIGVSQIKPIEYVAANNTYELNAVIDVAKSTMKINESSQSVYDNAFNIFIAKNPPSSTLDTNFYFNKNNGFHLKIQQMTSVVVTVSGGGSKAYKNTWNISASGGNVNGTYNESNSTVTFTNLDIYKNLTSFNIIQNKFGSGGKYNFFNLDTVTIFFNCQNK